MKRWITRLTAAALALAALDCVQPSLAEAQVVYVSMTGNDTSNDCLSPGTACRTFSTAQQRTSDGGTIKCAGVGFFSYITVTKALTLDCSDGGGGSEVAVVDVNAPGKTVRIRNIAINCANGTIAMNILAASNVYLEHVYVTSCSSSGAAIRDTRPASGKLLITNSTIVANAGPGIVIAPTSGAIVSAVLDNVKVQDNTYGLAVGARARVMVNRSVFSGNTIAGIESDPGGYISIKDTLLAGNTTGLLANAGSNVVLSNSRIDSNNTGISGPTRSFGGNEFFANAESDGTPPTPAGSASTEYGLR